MELGLPKMEPELTKSGAKIEKGALNRSKWLPDDSQDHFSCGGSPLFINFGVPSGTPKWIQNRSLIPKGAPRSDFFRIVSAQSVFLIVGLDFPAIFGEKTMKISMHFPKLRVNFSTSRWAKSMHRRTVSSTYCFVQVLKTC